MTTALGPQLATARLLLRPPRLEDLDGWARFAADGDAARFLGGPQPRLRAYGAMMSTVGSWTLQGFGMFSVLRRDTGEWIGRVGPLHPDGWPAPEIGWGLLPAHQGRGYAREAATAAAEFAFTTLGWPAIHHVIARENVASIAVARALGSRPLGPTRLPEPHAADDLELWGQTAAEWRGR